MKIITAGTSHLVLACLSVAILTSACSDSSDSGGTGSLPNCPEDYVLGSWLYRGDTVSITLDYGKSGEYGYVQSASGPPIGESGTYDLGNIVTSEDGLEVCEIRYTFDGAINPYSCLKYVFVDNGVLYESGCDLKLDFDVPFYYFGESMTQH